MYDLETADKEILAAMRTPYVLRLTEVKSEKRLEKAQEKKQWRKSSSKIDILRQHQKASRADSDSISQELNWLLDTSFG